MMSGSIRRPGKSWGPSSRRLSTTTIYLPKIFGKRIYDIVVGEFDTYDPRINPGVNNAFSTAAYRYGHTLIRPFFDRLDSSYQNTGTGPLELSQVFFNPDQFPASFGTDPLTRGLITQTSRRVDEFLSTVLTSNLFRTHLDLASLNIQRGRDHGLPPYLTWQRYCKEAFPELIDARFENVLTYVRFLELYGSLDTLDLWVGGLAEEREAGSLLGPTFACLFGITFANIRDGDRFYFKADGVFETAQRESIEQHSLAAIICDNGDSIDQLQEDVFLSGQPRVPCSRSTFSCGRRTSATFALPLNPVVSNSRSVQQAVILLQPPTLSTPALLREALKRRPFACPLNARAEMEVQSLGST